MTEFASSDPPLAAPRFSESPPPRTFVHAYLTQPFLYPSPHDPFLGWVWLFFQHGLAEFDQFPQDLLFALLHASLPGRYVTPLPRRLPDVLQWLSIQA